MTGKTREVPPQASSPEQGQDSEREPSVFDATKIWLGPETAEPAQVVTLHGKNDSKTTLQRLNVNEYEGTVLIATLDLEKREIPEPEGEEPRNIEPEYEIVCVTRAYTAYSDGNVDECMPEELQPTDKKGDDLRPLDQAEKEALIARIWGSSIVKRQ